MRYKLISLSFSLVIIFSLLIGSTTSIAQAPVQHPMLKPGMTSVEVMAQLPRNETLYFNGQQWDPVICWNPYSTSCNNSLAIAQQDNSRVIMFETPYIYNMLNGEQFPLLADGPYTWNEAMTELTFTLKTAAHWSDGTPVTADDVAYTWYANVTYSTNAGNTFANFIDDVTVINPHTVRVIAKQDGFGKAINPLMVEVFLNSTYVIQKAWTQTLEVRSGSDPDAFKSDLAEDVVWSGPYHKFYSDNSAVVFIRDDDYWGQDASMWGKLPTPKYLAHILYINNYAAEVAFETLKVDVSQQFIPDVQDLWLVNHLPISTYLPDAPYMVDASLPTAFYNLAAYGLDNAIIRKAIAIAIDYDAIVTDAMSNQSVTFHQVPRSLMNPSPYEQSLYDHDAVHDLQWTGSDNNGAKQLLDDAGIVDTNTDGWREYNGQTLHYVATCPNGWSDWMAAVEIIAEAGQNIGIDITTNYPDYGAYQNVVTNWSVLQGSAGYDIFMMWTDGVGPAEPWSRVWRLISSEFAGTDGNWNGNWGGYSNPAADAIIQAILYETDPILLKQYYTDLTEIYLTDIPSFSVMYRPQSFYAVNELIWKGFPHQGDGTNPPVPPLDLTDGYSIAGLYNLFHQVFIPLIKR